MLRFFYFFLVKSELSKGAYQNEIRPPTLADESLPSHSTKGLASRMAHFDRLPKPFRLEGINNLDKIARKKQSAVSIV